MIVQESCQGLSGLVDEKGAFPGKCIRVPRSLQSFGGRYIMSQQLATQQAAMLRLESIREFTGDAVKLFLALGADLTILQADDHKSTAQSAA